MKFIANLPRRMRSGSRLYVTYIYNHFGFCAMYRVCDVVVCFWLNPGLTDRLVYIELMVQQTNKQSNKPTNQPTNKQWNKARLKLNESTDRRRSNHKTLIQNTEMSNWMRIYKVYWVYRRMEVGMYIYIKGWMRFGIYAYIQNQISPRRHERSGRGKWNEIKLH